MLPAGLTQRALIEHRDTDRRVDQRLLLQRRGDDDFFQHILGSKGRQRGQQACAQEQFRTTRHRQILGKERSAYERKSSWEMNAPERRNETMTCSLRRY